MAEELNERVAAARARRVVVMAAEIVMVGGALNNHALVVKIWREIVC